MTPSLLESPELRRRALALRAEGLDVATMLTRLGISKDTLFRLFRLAGVVTPRRCSCCGRGLPGRRPPHRDTEPRRCARCRREEHHQHYHHQEAA